MKLLLYLRNSDAICWSGRPSKERSRLAPGAAAPRRTPPATRTPFASSWSRSTARRVGERIADAAPHVVGLRARPAARRSRARAPRRPPARARRAASRPRLAFPVRRRVQRAADTARADRSTPETGAPGAAPGATRTRNAPKFADERAHRRVIGARRDRRPARMPALLVEQPVVEHEIAAHLAQAERAQVGGEPPPLLRGERGVAAAHEQVAHRAVRADRTRGTHRPSRSDGVGPNTESAATAVSTFCVDAGISGRVGVQRDELAIVRSLDDERRDGGALEAARRERAAHRQPPTARAAPRRGGGRSGAGGADGRQQQHAQRAPSRTRQLCMRRARHPGGWLTRASLSIRLRAINPMRRGEGGPVLNAIWVGLVVIAVVVAAFTGKMEAVSREAFEATKGAIETADRPHRRDDPVPRSREGRVRRRPAALDRARARVRSCAGCSPTCRPSTRPCTAMIMNLAANMLGPRQRRDALRAEGDGRARPPEPAARQRHQRDGAVPGDQRHRVPPDAAHRHDRRSASPRARRRPSRSGSRPCSRRWPRRSRRSRSVSRSSAWPSSDRVRPRTSSRRGARRRPSCPTRSYPGLDARPRRGVAVAGLLLVGGIGALAVLGPRPPVGRAGARGRHLALPARHGARALAAAPPDARLRRDRPARSRARLRRADRGQQGGARASPRASRPISSRSWWRSRCSAPRARSRCWSARSIRSPPRWASRPRRCRWRCCGRSPARAPSR